MLTTTFTKILPLKMDQDGVIRVSKTRVTLDTIVASSLDGLSTEEIVVQHSVIPLVGVYLVFDYYSHQKEKVDAYLKRCRKLAEEILRQHEAGFNQLGIHARLLAQT